MDLFTSLVKSKFLKLFRPYLFISKGKHVQYLKLLIMFVKQNCERRTQKATTNIKQMDAVRDVAV